MPSVLIEVRHQYTQEQEVALMGAVRMALRESFSLSPRCHEQHRGARSNQKFPSFDRLLSVTAHGHSVKNGVTAYLFVPSRQFPLGEHEERLPWRRWSVGNQRQRGSHVMRGVRSITPKGHSTQVSHLQMEGLSSQLLRRSKTARRKALHRLVLLTAPFLKMEEPLIARPYPHLWV